MNARRPDPMPGSLEAAKVKTGKPRGPYALRQRRVRPRIFGEPVFEAELTDISEGVAIHTIAYRAWCQLLTAAEADDVDTGLLAVHSGYRSVAFQRQIFDYWVEERRKARAERGAAPLPLRELQKRQRKWTAAPGTSAHHTGLALDFKLYTLGKRAARRTPTYAWLATHAHTFGFYPYFPEAWHWEYNPPGLVVRLRELREAMSQGRPYTALLDPLAIVSL